MIRSARSNVTRPNPGIRKLRRRPREENLAWMARASASTPEFKQGDWSLVALLGGTDTLSFRLRVAQSHLRTDLLPSYWSHALLIDAAGGDFARATAIDVPLAQPGGIEFPPRSNGIQRHPLRDYDDPSAYANCAVLGFPIPHAKVLTAVDRLSVQRSTLDCLEHVVRWLAFGWGVAGTANPLPDNFGIPSAAMLEVVFSMAGLDLTPGLESRCSCPEAIWTAACWWQDYYAARQGPAPAGAYCIDHALAIEEPPTPTRVRRPRTKNK